MNNMLNNAEKYEYIFWFLCFVRVLSINAQAEIWKLTDKH